jgi:hypothetical protein
MNIILRFTFYSADEVPESTGRVSARVPKARVPAEVPKARVPKGRVSARVPKAVTTTRLKLKKNVEVTQANTELRDQQASAKDMKRIAQALKEEAEQLRRSEKIAARTLKNARKVAVEAEIEEAYNEEDEDDASEKLKAAEEAAAESKLLAAKKAADVKLAAKRAADVKLSAKRAAGSKQYWSPQPEQSAERQKEAAKNTAEATYWRESDPVIEDSIEAEVQRRVKAALQSSAYAPVEDFQTLKKDSSTYLKRTTFEDYAPSKRVAYENAHSRDTNMLLQLALSHQGAAALKAQASFHHGQMEAMFASFEKDKRSNEAQEDALREANAIIATERRRNQEHVKAQNEALWRERMREVDAIKSANLQRQCDEKLSSLFQSVFHK